MKRAAPRSARKKFSVLLSLLFACGAACHANAVTEWWARVRADRLSVDFRYAAGDEAGKNYFRWKDGGTPVRDGLDAVSGASRAGSTKAFNAVRFDASGRKKALPYALRALFLYAVTDGGAVAGDCFSASDSGGAVTVQFVHRGTAFRLVTDGRGRLVLRRPAPSPQGPETDEPPAVIDAAEPDVVPLAEESGSPVSGADGLDVSAAADGLAPEEDAGLAREEDLDVAPEGGKPVRAYSQGDAHAAVALPPGCYIAREVAEQDEDGVFAVVPRYLEGYVPPDGVPDDDGGPEDMDGGDAGTGILGGFSPEEDTGGQEAPGGDAPAGAGAAALDWDALPFEADAADYDAGYVYEGTLRFTIRDGVLRVRGRLSKMPL